MPASKTSASRRSVFSVPGLPGGTLAHVGLLFLAWDKQSRERSRDESLQACGTMLRRCSRLSIIALGSSFNRFYEEYQYVVANESAMPGILALAFAFGAYYVRTVLCTELYRDALDGPAAVTIKHYLPEPIWLPHSPPDEVWAIYTYITVYRRQPGCGSS